MERGAKTNWKQQYKLRHNWTKGSCAVGEIPVAEQPRIPPLVVQMRDGVIYTADQVDGLRAWSAKADRRLLAQTELVPSRKPSPPISLAVDDPCSHTAVVRVIVGFENGSFAVYALDSGRGRLRQIHSHESSGDGVVTAVATAWPYVLTMTATQRLSLYRFTPGCEGREGKDPLGTLDQPERVHSLKSHTVWPPLSICLRQKASHIIISVAYALPTYLSGWTVGIQEIQLAPDGDIVESRTASAIGEHYRPLAFAIPPMVSHLSQTTVGLATSSTPELRHIHSKPTSLSYTHPYLLVSHPDNTLTLYLVSSTADSLSIGAGSRLWGHTSSVSGAHVGGRGKAVSVSRRGDELRVWELEGGFVSTAARKRLATADISVRIKPEPPSASTARPHTGLQISNRRSTSNHERVQSPELTESLDDGQHELTITRGWIGFDEENVVVLKEESDGKQALMVYDFT